MSQGLPILVNAGSVPPKQTGFPVARISGAIACVPCVDRIWPRKATMSGCAASFGEGEHRARIGGSDRPQWRSSTCLPSAPPDLLTRSSAILAPVTAYLPLSAPWAGDGRHHADLDRIAASASDGGERGRRQTGCEP